MGLTKPTDNRCTTCLIDLRDTVMIFNPNLCLGCTIDYHSGIEKDKSFNQRVSKNAQNREKLKTV